MDRLHPLHAAVDRGLVGHGPDHDFRPRGPELIGVEPLLVIEGDDAVASLEKAHDQGRAGKARAACDQDSHRLSFPRTELDAGGRAAEGCWPDRRSAIGSRRSETPYRAWTTRGDAIDIPAGDTAARPDGREDTPSERERPRGRRSRREPKSGHARASLRAAGAER